MRPLLSSRFVLFPLLVAALAVSGCGPRDPVCNDCPDLAGAWTLTFDAPEPKPCGDADVGSGTLELTQVGSSLTGTFGDVPLEGTIFQSWNFTLSGNQAAPTDGGTGAGAGAGQVIHSLTGKFAPGQAALQTEDRLVGTYTAAYPGGCTSSGTYVATRVR